jgi:hypothetical protein
MWDWSKSIDSPKKWGWWGCCAWWLLTKAKAIACVCWSCSPEKSWLNLCVSWCQLCQHLWRLNLIWLVVWNMFILPFSWEFHNPSWLSLHDFFRGVVSTTNQVINNHH